MEQIIDMKSQGLEIPPKTLDEWQIAIYAYATEKGWWEDASHKSYGDLSTLFVSEVSEAFEEWRKGRELTEIYENEEKPGKPEGIPVEFADVLIRILDWCGHYKVGFLDYARLSIGSITMEYDYHILHNTYGSHSPITIYHWQQASKLFNDRDSWMARHPTFGDQCRDLVHLLSSENFADVSKAFLRILGWFEHHGLSAQEIMEKKHRYNLKRPYRHGGKRV